MSMALDYVFLKAWTTYDSVKQFKHKRRKTQNESSDGGFQLERVDLETLPDNAVEKNEAILDTGEHISLQGSGIRGWGTFYKGDSHREKG